MERKYFDPLTNSMYTEQLYKDFNGNDLPLKEYSEAISSNDKELSSLYYEFLRKCIILKDAGQVIFYDKEHKTVYAFDENNNETIITL